MSSTCSQLHICRAFLLKQTCEKFTRDGQCSHSHSLATKHNAAVLHRFDLDDDDDDDDDEKTLQWISKAVELSSLTDESSVTVRSADGREINADLIDQWLGKYKHMLLQTSPIHSSSVQFHFADRESNAVSRPTCHRHHSISFFFSIALVASMMRSYIQDQYSTTALVDEHRARDTQHVERTISNQRTTDGSPSQTSVGRGRGRATLWLPVQTPSASSLSTEKRVESETPTVRSFSRRLGVLAEARERNGPYSLSSTDCELPDTRSEELERRSFVLHRREQ